MPTTRPIRRMVKSQPTIEGAGVHLRRAFGYDQVPLLDPFLMLDDFRSSDPERYLPGFPWHPHRGIETITYMLEGQVEHGDSLGNRGVIGPGDVQWMTAGSGVVHQEMPQGDPAGRMGGFQLWANLPARQKMMDPRYRDVRAADIPVVSLPGGTTVRVVCGQAGGESGPVRDIVIDPQYLDVSVPPGGVFTHPVATDHTAFAYVVSGSGRFGPYPGTLPPAGGLASSEMLVIFGPGDQVAVRASEVGLRFLLISGRPLGEPIAWGGPIVMNTQEELQTAFEEYRKGTFLKHRRP